MPRLVERGLDAPSFRLPAVAGDRPVFEDGKLVGVARAAPWLYRLPLKPNSDYRVVVAEDDQDIAKLECWLLHKWGFDVVGAGFGGLAALRLARELEPDLLIVNNRMPDLDGPDVIANLRAGGAARRLKFILTSTDKFARAAEDSGADGLLPKPFDPQQMLVAVLRALRG